MNLHNIKRYCGAFGLTMLLLCGTVSSANAAEYETFRDLKQGAWYEGPVRFALDQRLMYSPDLVQAPDLFFPNAPITRGEFIESFGLLIIGDSVLAENAEAGGPYETEYADMYDHFLDVDADAPYADFVNWATRYGIVGGTSATTFAPEQQMTREQMATIIHNYLNLNGITLPPSTALPITFNDASDISYWAVNAVSAMQSSGLLVGDTAGNVQPQGQMTRSAAAAVLMRLSAQIETADVAPITADKVIVTYELEDNQIAVGKTATPSTQFMPMYTSNKTLEFHSSDESILSVTLRGALTAVGVGTATISVNDVYGNVIDITITVIQSPTAAMGHGFFIEDDFYHLDMTKDEVTALVGPATTQHRSATGMMWNLYNTDDYANFFMVVFDGNEVAELYSIGLGWSWNEAEMYAPYQDQSLSLKTPDGNFYDRKFMIDVNNDDTLYGIYYTENPDIDQEYSPARLKEESQLIFHLTNAFRVAYDVPVVTWNDKLESSSIAHCIDMATQDYFAHDSLDGRKPWDRMQEHGYNYSFALENLIAGYPTAIDSIDGWITSPAHREGLIHPRSEELGVGGSYNPNSYYQIYFAQNFGVEMIPKS